jgi:hypothetical protein
MIGGSIRRLLRHGAWASIGFVLALVAVGVTAPAVLVPAAQAEQARSCVLNGDYGWTRAMELSGQAQDNDARGTRADIYIPTSGAQCQRVASVYGVSPSRASRFEFGFFIGYHTCGSDTKFYVHPTLFYWAHHSNGTSQCGVWTGRHPLEGQYDAFRASDINANTYWGSYFNGEALQPDGINMDFSKSYNAVGSERGGAADDGTARFHQLNEYHDGNGWTIWNGLTDDAPGHNPGYHLDVVNTYTGNVVAN